MNIHQRPGPVPTNREVMGRVEQLVLSGLGRDPRLEWVKLLVGGHCEQRRRETQNKGGI